MENSVPMMEQMIELQKQSQLLMKQMMMMMENQGSGGSLNEEPVEEPMCVEPNLEKKEDILEVPEPNMGKVFTETSQNLGKKVGDSLIFVKELPKVVDDKNFYVGMGSKLRKSNQLNKKLLPPWPNNIVFDYVPRMFDEMPIRNELLAFGFVKLLFDPGIEIKSGILVNEFRGLLKEEISQDLKDKVGKFLGLQADDKGSEISSLFANQVHLVKVCDKDCACVIKLNFALKVFVQMPLRSEIWYGQIKLSFDPGIHTLASHITYNTLYLNLSIIGDPSFLLVLKEGRGHDNGYLEARVGIGTRDHNHITKPSPRSKELGSYLVQESEYVFDPGIETATRMLVSDFGYLFKERANVDGEDMACICLILRDGKVIDFVIAWVDYQSKRRQGVTLYEKRGCCQFVHIVQLIQLATSTSSYGKLHKYFLSTTKEKKFGD